MVARRMLVYFLSILVISLLVCEALADANEKGGNSLLSCDSGSVALQTTETALTFGTWQLREVTTFKVNPTCYGWDFLGDGGFFPMTWYYYPDPTIFTSGDNTVYDYQWERDLWGRCCYAKPDGINSFIPATYTMANGTELMGIVKVIPDEKAGIAVTIGCGPTVDPTCTRDFCCEEALLDWTGREDVHITVQWVS